MRRAVLSWLVLLCGTTAPAAGEPVEVLAETLEYESRRQVVEARGAPGRPVVIRQGDRELQAEWLTYSRRTRRGVASGEVRVRDGEDRIRTSFVEFDLDTLQGAMFDADFVGGDDSRFLLQGAEVAKTGERTYRFREGRFTTCRCPDPDARKPWVVTAEEADLEFEGYGTARNTTVEVLGVPVLWLPWMIYPLKTERQSGLLFPDIAISGRNGIELGLPVFWAAADPVNVIFTPRWLQKRGAKGDLQVEYVVGRHSGGEFFASGLHDQDVDSGTPRTPFDAGRWATEGEHYFSLDAGVQLKAAYAFASDNQHVNDFDDLGQFRQDRFLPAQAFLTKSWGVGGGVGGFVGAEYFDDLQAPDDTDRDDTLLNRLPEVSVMALPRGLPVLDWLVPALDVDYAWFRQAERADRLFDPTLLVTTNGRFLDTGLDGLPTVANGAGVEQGRSGTGLGPDPNADNHVSFDPVNGTALGTEGDGVFQEGERIADQGHRVVLTPRLGLPFSLFDTVEVYPEVGWHETLYQSAADGFDRRGFATGRLDVRSRLRGVFGRITHVLEPQLGWAWAQDVSQRDKPFFVPATAVPQERVRALALDNVTRDTADRIAGAHLVMLGVGNRLWRRPSGPHGGAALLADVLLRATYDLEDGAFGGIFLDGLAYPLRGVGVRGNLGFDPGRGRFTELLLAGGARDSRGDSLHLGYRFLRDVPRFFEAYPQQNDRFAAFSSDFDRVHQLFGGVRIALDRSWAVFYNGAYSFERGVFLGNSGGIEYVSKCRCWAARLELSEHRTRGVSINLRYTLVGLGDDSRSPFEGAPYSGAGLLDSAGAL